MKTKLISIEIKPEKAAKVGYILTITWATEKGMPVHDEYHTASLSRVAIYIARFMEKHPHL